MHIHAIFCPQPIRSDFLSDFLEDAMQKRQKPPTIRAMRNKVAATSAGPAVVIPNILDGVEILNAPVQKRGRPLKSSTIRAPANKQARGRKKKWTSEARQCLIDQVDRYQSEHPGTTDVQALEHYRKMRADQLGVHLRSDEIPNVKTLQNVLRESRALGKRNPENSQ